MAGRSAVITGWNLTIKNLMSPDHLRYMPVDSVTIILSTGISMLTLLFLDSNSIAHAKLSSLIRDFVSGSVSAMPSNMLTTPYSVELGLAPPAANRCLTQQ